MRLFQIGTRDGAANGVTRAARDPARPRIRSINSYGAGATTRKRRAPACDGCQQRVTLSRMLRLPTRSRILSLRCRRSSSSGSRSGLGTTASAASETRAAGSSAIARRGGRSCVRIRARQRARSVVRARAGSWIISSRFIAAGLIPRGTCNGSRARRRGLKIAWSEAVSSGKCCEVFCRFDTLSMKCR